MAMPRKPFQNQRGGIAVRPDNSESCAANGRAARFSDRYSKQRNELATFGSGDARRQIQSNYAISKLV
jgi:hypothetical protein